MIDVIDIAYRISYIRPNCVFSVKESINDSDRIMYKNQHESIHDYKDYCIIWSDSNKRPCPSKKEISSIDAAKLQSYRNQTEMLQIIDGAKSDINMVGMYYNAKMINPTLLFEDYVKQVYALRQELLNGSAQVSM